MWDIITDFSYYRKLYCIAVPYCYHYYLPFCLPHPFNLGEGIISLLGRPPPSWPWPLALTFHKIRLCRPKCWTQGQTSNQSNRTPRIVVNSRTVVLTVKAVRLTVGFRRWASWRRFSFSLVWYLSNCESQIRLCILSVSVASWLAMPFSQIFLAQKLNLVDLLFIN